MKKWMAFVLLFVCAFVLTACNQYKEPLSCVFLNKDDSTVTTAKIDLPEVAQKEIISALNSGKWFNDVTNCSHDYEFTTENQTIRYHSECGTFIDITNRRAMTLSEATKEEINELLESTK